VQPCGLPGETDGELGSHAEVRSASRPPTSAELLGEFEKAGQFIGEEWWRLRERYYEALRTKERAELDGSNADKRIAQWWLTACWDDWFDIGELQKAFAETKRRWMLKAMAKQADEIAGLKAMELM